MAQTFYPITPVEVTPGVSGSHQDVDCSSYIAEGATGVILQIVNLQSYGREVGLRKNGSTDDRPFEIYDESHLWAMVGVDEDRIFDCEVENVDDVDVYLIGYTMSGVTFKTNADDISMSDEDDWYDIDCSTEAPNAVGVIIEITSTGSYNFGCRKELSTDDRHRDASVHSWAIIGCDESQIIEGYVESLGVDFFLVGYVTDGATFSTNADDKSLGDIGSYIDIDCSTEAPGAGMLFVEVIYSSESGGASYGLREDDESGGYHDIYWDIVRHAWAIIKCDDSQVIEGKIENITVDFFLVGYAEKAPVAGGGDKTAHMAAKMIAGKLI